MISRLMDGYTCAELETMINEAGIYAGFDRRDKIEQNDLFRAFVRMAFKVPKSVEEDDSVFVPSMAVHEAGHVVVAEILEPGSVDIVSISTSVDYPKGITVVRHSDKFRASFKAQRNEAVRKFGGRAATEIVYGEVDMGSHDDLREAYHFADKFVNEDCAFGFDSFKRFEMSEEFRKNSDKAAAQEMDRLYREAKQIIVENRTLLDAITEELIAKKILTYKDIKEIRKKCSC